MAVCPAYCYPNVEPHSSQITTRDSFQDTARKKRMSVS